MKKYYFWACMVIFTTILYVVLLIQVAKYNWVLAVALLCAGPVMDYINNKFKYYDSMVHAAEAVVSMRDVLHKVFNEDDD